MKATLTRIYKDGSKINMFSSSLEGMDLYLISNFKNKEDLEKYFCKMKKNITDDGTIDNGIFLLTCLTENKEYIELPILYKEDYISLKNMLINDLLINFDFMNEVSNKYPDIFTKDLYNKMIILMDKDIVDEKHNSDEVYFEQQLFMYQLENNFRMIHNEVMRYIQSNKIKVKTR